MHNIYSVIRNTSVNQQIVPFYVIGWQAEHLSADAFTSGPDVPVILTDHASEAESVFD